MTLVMKNFGVILIIASFQSISIQSETKIGKLDSVLSRQMRSTEDPIRLKKLIWANLNRVKECSVDKVKIESIYVLKEKQKRGSTFSCLTDEWVLSLNEDDLHQPGNSNTCPETTPCKYCFCVPRTLDPAELSRSSDHISLFSLQPLVSDTASNMVITGLKFELDKDRIIQLKMQQGKLLPDGTIEGSKSWKDLVDFQKLTTPPGPPLNYTKLKFNEDVVLFSKDTRTVYLDKIFVPDNYVVTGVKFSRFVISDDQKGVRMLVRGTPYDSSYTLSSDTDQWYDSDNNTIKDESYKAGRMEIPLKNYGIPSPGSDNHEIEDTNKLIRFRGTTLNTDMESKIIPYIESLPVETVNSSFLRGVELSYKGKSGFGGYIILKLHYHQSPNTTGSLAVTTTLATTEKSTVTTKLATTEKFTAIAKLVATESLAATEKLTGIKQSTNNHVLRPNSHDHDVNKLNNHKDSASSKPKHENSAATSCFQLIFIIILPLIIVLQ